MIKEREKEDNYSKNYYIKIFFNKDDKIIKLKFNDI